MLARLLLIIYIANAYRPGGFRGKKENSMGFRIYDQGSCMVIVDNNGETIAKYAYSHDIMTGHEDNHKWAIAKMRKAIKAHLANGGTLGNYPW
jgi:hypothetical protein